jgi:hypothetical protein
MRRFEAFLLFTLAALLSSLGFAQQWTPPQTGWLYVLDAGGTTGSVFVVDPNSGTKSTLPAGYHPDFGLCGNGSKLYVVSGAQSSSTLSIYSTKTGSVLAKIALSHRAIYTVLPSMAGLACSSDSKWVVGQQMITVAPELDQHALWVINTQTDQLSSQMIQLPAGCGIARLAPWPFGKWSLSAQCSTTNTLRLIALNSTGQAADITDITLNLAPQWTVHKPGLPAVVHRMTTSSLANRADGVVDILRGGGGVDQLNPSTLVLQPKVADSWEQWIPSGAAGISDSGIAFIGSVPYEEHMPNGRALLNTISRVRASDWTQLSSVQTSTPFSSLVLSANGQYLYTANPTLHSVSIFDAKTLTEVKTIHALGAQPSVIITQP